VAALSRICVLTIEQVAPDGNAEATLISALNTWYGPAPAVSLVARRSWSRERGGMGMTGLTPRVQAISRSLVESYQTSRRSLTVRRFLFRVSRHRNSKHGLKGG